MAEAARISRDGQVYWCQPGSGAGPPRPLPPQLYAGTLGVALFLAATAAVYGEQDCRGLCLRGIAPLRREICAIAGNPHRRERVSLPIGGLAGLGSIAYGLVAIGDLLNDEAVVADGVVACTLIDHSRIDADRHLDVMLGCAGAALALLALAQWAGPVAGRQALDLAARCAHRLADHGGDAAAGAEGQAAGGFCHGAAGMAAAMLRVAERTGDPLLMTAARRLLVRHQAARNSPAAMDSASEGRRAASPVSWCKGASGIAIGCIAAREVLGGPSWSAAVDDALDTVGEAPRCGRDDLCCGSSGRIDTLAYAAQRGGGSVRLASARRLAAGMLEEAERNGRFLLPLPPSGYPDVRLFPGSSGIGYGLLRLVAPYRVPAVLALEIASGARGRMELGDRSAGSDGGMDPWTAC